MISNSKLALAAVLLAAGGAAQAATATLVSHTLVSSGGTPSTLYSDAANCAIGFAAGTGLCVAANATWDWSGGVLTGTGTYQAWTRVGGNPFSVVLADSVDDLVINTNTASTSASSYRCIEGNFLAGVGANGCANTLNGADFVSNTTMAYNVGGNAACVVRTVGGDDTIGGNPRGVGNFAGGGGCDATDGAFVQYLVNYTANFYGAGLDRLILANQANYTAANGNYMTFQVVVPVPAAVWLFGSALGLIGFMRRRLAA